MVCRRRIAWSTATFSDAVLSSFIIPFGPLLLVHFLQLDSSNGIGGDVVPQNETRSAVSEASLQWMTSSRLWSQVRWSIKCGRYPFGERWRCFLPSQMPKAIRFELALRGICKRIVLASSSFSFSADSTWLPPIDDASKKRCVPRTILKCSH